MFELCKKVQVYHIQHNYYSYLENQNQHKPNNKLALHLLKALPIQLIYFNKPDSAKKTKRGLMLSKAIEVIPTQNKEIQKVFIPFRTKQQKQQQTQTSNYNYLSSNYKKNISRLRTATQQNEQLIYSLYNMAYSPKVHCWDEKSSEPRTISIQVLAKKQKPIIKLQQLKQTDSIMKKRRDSDQQANKCMNDTTKPPISSKIETCYTNGLPSSQHIASKYEPQIRLSFHQSLQNQESKLISISKSISSMHETINQKDHRRYDLENDSIEKSGNEFSISLSNIFSRQDSAGFDCRKSLKENSMKRLSLFLDSERHTIQSRFSKQLDPDNEQDAKIQQSFIYSHDPKQKFNIFEENKIRKKQYNMSLAIERNINFVVSIKQAFSDQLRLIVQQLHIYELVQRHLKNKPAYLQFLQLYQVQITEGSYLFIKQPYQISLQAKLKQVNHEQGLVLRQKAKKIAFNVLQFLQNFNIRASRQITTHQFVLCAYGVKIHDLSFFHNQADSLLSKQQIVSGIDI